MFVMSMYFFQIGRRPRSRVRINSSTAKIWTKIIQNIFSLNFPEPSIATNTWRGNTCNTSEINYAEFHYQQSNEKLFIIMKWIIIVENILFPFQYFYIQTFIFKIEISIYFQPYMVITKISFYFNEVFIFISMH